MIKKIGIYQLKSVKEKADDWIVLADESIGIGQEKLLVVQGIRQSNIDFTRQLMLQDMEPITIKSSGKLNYVYFFLVITKYKCCVKTSCNSDVPER